VVAATLMDGTVTLRSFNDAHLWNPALRALMAKIEVVANDEFTKANQRVPVEHRTRVTVKTASDKKFVGASGGDGDDLSTPKSDAKIEEKFRGLAEYAYSARQMAAILGQLWKLEELPNVAEIPRAFILD